MTARGELDKQILEEKSASYLGSAKVRLSNLRFDSDLQTSCRAINESNVTRLEAVFALEGCLRLEPDHHVPAIIPAEILSKALADADLTPAELLTLKEPPFLDISDNFLLCLHGQHRIEAARRFLGSYDDWWVTDLYSEGR
jgi:hypothetical protein